MISESIKETIKRALDEDIKSGDITTKAIVSERQKLLLRNF